MKTIFAVTAKEKRHDMGDKIVQEITESIKRYNKNTCEISHELVAIQKEYTGGSKVWLRTDFFNRVVAHVLHANFICKCVEAFCPVDVAPKSEGEWIITNNRNLEIIRECSHCHAKTYYPIALRFNCRLTRYCEDCGAKMKEATDE